MHLAILGPIAAGKTSVGTRVARRLDVPWFDSDEQIATQYGETGRAIATREGVPELHRIELLMLRRALAAADSVVVSPAASVVDVDDGREALSRDDVCCVLLMADVDTVLKRVADDDHRRPITRQELQRLYERRVPVWHALASAVYATDERDPAAVADEIVALFRSRV